MATILAHIKVNEGCAERFEAIAASLFASTHAEESGIERYEYWRAQKPLRYYALLAFVDYRAFLAHQSSEHHEAFTEELGELIDEMRLEWVDPVESASHLGSTRPQDLGADASELERSYDAVMAPRIAPWWPPRD
jgi:quinol monooxygenase YgiN